MRVHPAVRWAAALGLVGAIVWRTGADSVGARLGTVESALAVPAIAGLVLVHLIGVQTWRRLTQQLAGLRLDPQWAIRRYFAAQAVGAVTPGNVGADIYRALSIDVEGGRPAAALAVVAQRATSVAALLVLGVMGSLVLTTLGGRGAGGASVVATLAAVSVAVLAASLVAAALMSRGGAPIVRWIGRSVGIADQAWRSMSWAGAIRDGLLLGLLFHGLSLILGLALVVAVDRSIAPRSMEVLGALAVARLSLALPITPNGLGVQEGAVAVLFVALGLAPDVALASLLLNRLALVAVVLLGGVAMATNPAEGPAAARAIGGNQREVAP